MASLKLLITSPDTRSERSYPPDLTVEELKRKLFSITGIPVPSQSLLLFSSEDDNAPLRRLDQDDQSLASFGVDQGMHIKVVDLDPSQNMSGQFNDVSLVDKFELSQEEYEQRRDTVRAYKERNKMGRFAPQPDKPADAVDPSSSHVEIGKRCRIPEDADTPERRGVVRFFGSTKFGKDGSVWVGIELDEPLGKNNGAVQGEQYFQCADRHGVFVKPSQVECGDYPPIDPFEEEETEM